MDNSKEPQFDESNDPVLDRVREARHQISARFDHDPSKLVAHYMELQERYSERLVSYAPDESPEVNLAQQRKS